MGIIVNDEYYECYNSTNTSNITNDNTKNYVKCNTLIGYSYNDAVPISFLVISIRKIEIVRYLL